MPGRLALQAAVPVWLALALWAGAHRRYPVGVWAWASLLLVQPVFAPNSRLRAQVIPAQRGIARDGTPDIGAYEYVAVSTPGDSGDGDGGCLFTASHGGGGPVDPTLPLHVITAAMFLALSRAGYRPKQRILVR